MRRPFWLRWLTAAIERRTLDPFRAERLELARINRGL